MNWRNGKGAQDAMTRHGSGEPAVPSVIRMSPDPRDLRDTQ